MRTNEKEKGDDYWCPGIFSCPGKKFYNCSFYISVGDCKIGKTGGKWRKG